MPPADGDDANGTATGGHGEGDGDARGDGGESPAIRVFAGECTTEYEGTREQTRRGQVVVVVKPDRTTLVHDADGYQPVAWLTRPDSLTVETGTAVTTRDPTSTGAGADADRGFGSGPGSGSDSRSGSGSGSNSRSGTGFGLVARSGEETLRVTCHEEAGRARYPVSPAGVPVGDCPDCGGVLVRSTDVVCLDCRARYPLPSGATVTDGTCDDCGLPLARVERGRTFELCLDPGCEALYDVVTDAFDRAWDCPDCGADLRVERARGRVYLACDDRRDCETTVSIPDGLVVGECDCGLPVFETATGRRCADGACDRDWDPRRDGPDGRETDDDASRAG